MSATYQSTREGAHEATWGFMREEAAYIAVYSANIGGIGTGERYLEQFDHFSTCVPSLIGFQELTERALEVAFSQHHLEFKMGETIGDYGFHNAWGYDTRQLKLLASKSVRLAGNIRRGVTWGTKTERTVHLGLFRHQRTRVPVLGYNTQFDNVDDEARLESARLIIEIDRLCDKCLPRVLLGDLNMTIGHRHRKWPRRRKAPYRVLQKAGFKDAIMAAREPKAISRPRLFSGFRPGINQVDPYGLIDPDVILVQHFEVLNCIPLHPSMNRIPMSDHSYLMADLKFIDIDFWKEKSDEQVLGMVHWAQ
jgi:hypothetical protein